MLFDRRKLLIGGGALLAGGTIPIMGCAPKTAALPRLIQSPALAELETRAGGRLGAFILDTASGMATGHRFDERFALCSTFKLSLAAAILKMADQGTINLDTLLPYTKSDLMPNSPITTENLTKGGMTVEELAKATQMTSDNTAANVLMRHIGGPAAMTAYWRSLGDTISRADRYEPEMNFVPEGEVRDTTSPQAMARSMAQFLTTDALPSASREKLLGWMAETKTGTKRIRAGLPQSWRQGDKTGTGSSKKYNSKYNDIAIFWPPARTPVIVTAYYEADGRYTEMRDQDQAVLAEVGRIAAATAVEWAGGLD
jgi:beta-lactamase class A